MVKVTRACTLARTLSCVGASCTGTSKGMIRRVTRWETTIHGGSTRVPLSMVLRYFPRFCSSPFAPSGMRTRKLRKMASTKKIGPSTTAALINRALPARTPHRIPPTRMTTPISMGTFPIRFCRLVSTTIGVRPLASGLTKASAAWSSGTRTEVSCGSSGANAPLDWSTAIGKSLLSSSCRVT